MTKPTVKPATHVSPAKVTPATPVTVHHVKVLPTTVINGVKTFDPSKGNNIYDGAVIKKGETVKINGNESGHHEINGLVNSGTLVLGGLMI